MKIKLDSLFFTQLFVLQASQIAFIADEKSYSRISIAIPSTLKRLRNEDIMTFKKIDAKTIRCVLTADDMEENHIGLDDFFSSDKEKIHSFMDTLLEAAKAEIGYETDGSVMSMQLMPLPKNGLAITISGNTENDFREMIENAANVMSEVEAVGKEIDAHTEEDAAMLNLFEKEMAEEQRSSNVREIKPAFTKVFRFTSLDEIADFSKSVQMVAKNVKSSVYKDAAGGYLLTLVKGSVARERFGKLCMMAMEFAVMLPDSKERMQYLKEHCEVIIKAKAIEKMCSI